jgi:hypothetical protein
MANSLERRTAKLERTSKAIEDEDCDWAIVCADAGLGDEKAKVLVERAKREQWPSYEAFWAPFMPGGSHYKPGLFAETESAGEEGMGCA